MLTYFIYILGTIVFTVYGQLILKWRIGKYGELPDQITHKVTYMFNVLLDPFIISGLLSAFFKRRRAEIKAKKKQNITKC